MLCKNTYICVPFQCEKNVCFNYREFDLENDLVGMPHTWYLLGQSFMQGWNFVGESLARWVRKNEKEMCRFAEDMS